jgi:hypothetical protein
VKAVKQVVDVPLPDFRKITCFSNALSIDRGVFLPPLRLRKQ